MTDNRLFISFSGGETSAFMAHWLLENKADQYDEVVTLFANTGQENEETLEFVQKCDDHFGLDVVWVEAVINQDFGVGPSFKVVDYDTACRTGESSFEPMIDKFGIPNMTTPHCTKQLKQYPMTAYLRSIGWGPRSYDTAIGIRIDEGDRMNPQYREKRLIYPLIQDVPMTKQDVNLFWRDMPFRLPLKGYQGNCKWCWKKSLRKHLTIMSESPEHYDFPERMEKEKGQVGRAAKTTGQRQVFFRDRISVKDLRRMAKDKDFVPAADDSVVYNGQQLRLDLSAGCSESCEVLHD